MDKDMLAHLFEQAGVVEIEEIIYNSTTYWSSFLIARLDMFICEGSNRFIRSHPCWLKLDSCGVIASSMF
ncbi:hypothetical protein LIER_34101 [Lithospermum erythrorhizon]|uniref:Uncharacterized protein n=1 Tax=Lithospermum erythrorhizon TaxID=34254 RepID=A0AAV3RYP7_LITER